MANEQFDNLSAAFIIDPRSPEFRDLRSVCEPGNPWRCLIATVAGIELGRRVTARVDHDTGTGVLGLTEGEFRYERPMTRDEVVFATKFDLQRGMRKPLTVVINLNDGTWARKPKRAGGGEKNAANRHGAGERRTRTIRERQLKQIRAAAEERLLAGSR